MLRRCDRGAVLCIMSRIMSFTSGQPEGLSGYIQIYVGTFRHIWTQVDMIGYIVIYLNIPIETDNNRWKSIKILDIQFQSQTKQIKNDTMMTNHVNLGNAQLQSQTKPTKTIHIDENQCKSRKCPTPEFDKTNRNDTHGWQSM